MTVPVVTLQVAWSDGPGATAPLWSDVPAGDLLAWSVRLGRSAGTDDTTNPGTMRAVLENSRRQYDPTGPTSGAVFDPVFGDFSGRLGLGPTPGRPVRLRITWAGATRTLWQGVVGPAGFQQQAYAHDRGHAVIDCVDLVGHAASVAVPGVFPAGPTMTQAQQVLEAAGLAVVEVIDTDPWDAPVVWGSADRPWGSTPRFAESFTGGRTTVGEAADITSVAAYLRDIEATDQGRVYHDPVAGQIVGVSYLESRTRARSKDPQWVIGDGGTDPTPIIEPEIAGDAVVGGELRIDQGVWDLGDTPYRFSDIEVETLPLLNDVTVKVADDLDTEARVVDDAAVAAYGRGSVSLSSRSTIGQDAAAIAAYTVAKRARPVTVVSRLSLNPAGSNALWPLVYGLQLFDRVTLIRTPHNVPPQVVQDYIVEGMEVTAGDGVESFTMALYLSPVATDTVAMWDDSRTRWDDPTRFWGI